jgi:hypothetical protein
MTTPCLNSGSSHTTINRIPSTDTMQLFHSHPGDKKARVAVNMVTGIAMLVGEKRIMVMKISTVLTKSPTVAMETAGAIAMLVNNRL